MVVVKRMMALAIVGDIDVLGKSKEAEDNFALHCYITLKR